MVSLGLTSGSADVFIYLRRIVLVYRQPCKVYVEVSNLLYTDEHGESGLV